MSPPSELRSRPATTSAEGADDRPHMLGRVSEWLHRHLLVGLALCYLLATFWPAPGVLLRQSQWLGLPLSLWLLAILMFAAGLSLNGEQWRRSRGLGWLTPATVTLMWALPAVLLAVLVTVVGRTGLGGMPGLMPALLLISLMPAAGSSVGWSQLAGGNMAFSVGLVALSTVLSPLILTATGGATEGTSTQGAVAVSFASATSLLICVVLAVSAGVGTRHWLIAEGRDDWRPVSRLAAAAALLLLNYMNAAVALPQFVSGDQPLVLLRVFFSVGTFCSVMFASAWLLARAARLPQPMQSSLVLGVGMKNTGMALVVAGVQEATSPIVIVTIIFYTLAQHLLAGAYRRFVTAQATVPAPE